MAEIYQGLLIGVFITSVVWIDMISLTINYVENLWKYRDLRATFSFHYFLTRSKIKSYYLTLFRSV